MACTAVGKVPLTMHYRLIWTFIMFINICACSAFAAPGDPDLTLRNDFIEVGISKDFGGAITYLSVRGQGRNLINNHDKGRQVQQSVYAGDPIDRKSEGQRENWSPWPWNPVQAGDAYGNKSNIIEATAAENQIYTKVQPMLWDMNNELAEAYYETWITLEGPVVHVRNTLTCFRTDNRWNVTERDQEMPAVFGIGALDHIFAYQGGQPWTSGGLTRLPNTFPPKRYGFPEKWAAVVNAENWGFGVYSPDAEELLAAFHGTPPGETADDPTGYLAPISRETLDKNTVFSYEYALIAGTLDEIRAYAYLQEGHTPASAFNPVPPAPAPSQKLKALAVLGLPIVVVIAVLVVVLRRG